MHVEASDICLVSAPTPHHAVAVLEVAELAKNATSAAKSGTSRATAIKAATAEGSEAAVVGMEVVTVEEGISVAVKLATRAVAMAT